MGWTCSKLSNGWGFTKNEPVSRAPAVMWRSRVEKVHLQQHSSFRKNLIRLLSLRKKDEPDRLFRSVRIAVESPRAADAREKMISTTASPFRKKLIRLLRLRKNTIGNVPHAQQATPFRADCCLTRQGLQTRLGQVSSRNHHPAPPIRTKTE